MNLAIAFTSSKSALRLTLPFLSPCLQFMNSRVIDWPYPRYGINYSRGEMVRFLEDIMHLAGEDGPEALEHLQVLLGYGLTGHTSNQVRIG